MSNSSVLRATLDSIFDRMKTIQPSLQTRDGWVRRIRTAIEMSQEDLAARLGVAKQSVQALESAESRGAVSLKNLRKAADAMDCDVVYALVPRRSLDSFVQANAIRVARNELDPIRRSMQLENQDSGDVVYEKLIADRANQLIAAEPRKIWKNSSK